MSTCSNCGGEGEVKTAPFTGALTMECSVCEGDRMVKCPECDGLGEED